MDLLRQYEGHHLVSSAVPVTRDTIPENREDEDADDEQDPEQVHRAQKLGGELLWLAMRTRPDISFGVSHLCSLTTRKPEAAIKVGKMILRYLSGTADVGLVYEGAGPELVAFSDASFAPHGGRSFGCAGTAVHGGFVAWRMAKQSVVAMSVAALRDRECSTAGVGSQGVAQGDQPQCRGRGLGRQYRSPGIGY